MCGPGSVDFMTIHSIVGNSRKEANCLFFFLMVMKITFLGIYIFTNKYLSN